MNELQSHKRDFEAIAWGAIFLWWGIMEVVPSLPKGVGAAGFGLILLGVNAARAREGIAISHFSMVVGILALVLGGLKLAGPLLHMPFELPIFAILLIVLGAYFLVRQLVRMQPQ